MEATENKVATIRNGKNDFLGTEKIGKLMLKFSVPCVLSLLVSALYNIVDQIFIGHSELGTLGNAATGAVFPIFIIAQAFAWWFGDGCAAFLSICQGKNNAQTAHKAIGNGILITLAASLILIAVFFPLRRPVLMFFGASENSIDYAVQYLNIILAFFPAFMLMNMMNSVVRADGSPGWAMASMLTGAISNIVLDAVFILVLHWGLAGAAWATVIGQTASFAICAFYLLRKTKTFKLGLKSFKPDPKEFAKAAKPGISSFIAQMTIDVIAVSCNAMLAEYGATSVYGADIPIAVIAVESKVFTIVINVVVGIVLGCQPIIGYNIGAGNTERVKKTFLYILLCTIVIGLVSTLVFECAPKSVVGIFGEPKAVDPDAYWDFGIKTFRIFLMLITFTCVMKMTSIFFQAVGKPVFAVIASTVRDIVCFVPLVFLLPLRMGIDGILWAAPIADLVAAIVATSLTVVYFKKLKRPAAIDARSDLASVAPIDDLQ